MKSILIPTDFSEAADNAYLYGLHLANHLDLKIYVLYSYMSPVLSATHGGQPELLQSIYEEIELSKFDTFKKNVAVLRKLAAENNLDPNNVVFLFEEGPLVSSVKKTIANEDIYAIVMGTIGASGISQAIIGTNTVNVIKNVTKPVLAIPTKAKFKPIDKVAFTTLFRDKDKPALQEIVRISEKVPFDVYCVNVLNNPDYIADVLIAAEEWGKEYDNANLEFVFLEKEETVENTVNKFLAENKVDILAVVKRNRNFFDRLINASLSNEFVFHSHIPTWVFHEER